jgi:hypothetical protein
VKTAAARSGTVVREKRRKMSWDGGRGVVNIKVIPKTRGGRKPGIQTRPPNPFILSYYTPGSLPSKASFIFALLLCTLSGFMTPIFSFLLSQLLFEVSVGGTHNRFGGILLAIGAFDGQICGCGGQTRGFEVWATPSQSWTSRKLLYGHVSGRLDMPPLGLPPSFTTYGAEFFLDNRFTPQRRGPLFIL